MTQVLDKSRHEDAVLHLKQRDSDKKQIIKFVKNAIIGNRTNKQIYICLGLVNELVQTMENADDELKTEIVIVICSLAHGSRDQVEEITRQGALEPLFNCLNVKVEKLVQAAAKAIRAIMQYPEIVSNVKNEWVNILIAKLHLENSNIGVASTCASGNLIKNEIIVLAKMAQASTSIQSLILDIGGIEPLILLLQNDSLKSKEAALEALGSVCFKRYQTVSEISLLKSIFKKNSNIVNRSRWRRYFVLYNIRNKEW